MKAKKTTDQAMTGRLPSFLERAKSVPNGRQIKGSQNKKAAWRKSSIKACAGVDNQ